MMHSLYRSKFRRYSLSSHVVSKSPMKHQHNKNDSTLPPPSPPPPILNNRSRRSSSIGSSISNAKIKMEKFEPTMMLTEVYNFAFALVSFMLWPLIGVIFAFRRGIQGVYAVTVYLRIIIDLLFFAVVRSLRYFGGYAKHRSYIDGDISFSSWLHNAARLDKQDGYDLWRGDAESIDYDWTLLRRHQETLQKLLDEKNILGVMAELQQVFNRSHCGIDNPQLHGFYCRVGTKNAITEYKAVIDSALHWICTSQSLDLNIDQKLQFFRRGYAALGSTALCLSGGGSLAMYHLGVVKALLTVDLLPRVISGTSGGSIVAGILARYTDDEVITEIIQPDISNRYEGKRWFEPIHKQLLHFSEHGVMMDWRWFQETTKSYYGDMTFLEAFQRTGRHVNIAVSRADTSGSGKAHPPMILNHISSPHVFLHSAITASCACPGLMAPLPLFAKGKNGSVAAYDGMLFMDGSILADVPELELRRLYNTTNFIVSQVNPHVAPFVKRTKELSGFMPSTLENLEIFFNRDIKYRVTRLCQKGLIPRFFGQDLRGVFLQKYQATTREHVTIVPSYSVFDGYMAIQHPSEPDMHRYIRKGLIATWPKIMQIKSRMSIELKLRECVDFLEEQSHFVDECRAISKSPSYDSTLFNGNKEIHLRSTRRRHSFF